MSDTELSQAVRTARVLGLAVPAERQAALAAEVTRLREAAERCRAELRPDDEPGLPRALDAEPIGA